MARSTDATPTIVPRKRPRIEYYSDEDEDPDDPPCKARANSSHFSREKIGSILGGIDRGWGTTKYVSVITSCTSQFDGSSMKGAVLGPNTHTTLCLMETTFLVRAPLESRMWPKWCLELARWITVLSPGPSSSHSFFPDPTLETRIAHISRTWGTTLP